MIRARSFQSDRTFDPGMLVPPPTSIISPTFQMPHVFVHPPEEEQADSPPWCFFDADTDATAQPGAFTSPEMADMEAKLGVWEEVVDAWENPVNPTADYAPLFQRASGPDEDVVMPRRSSFHHSRPSSPPRPASVPMEPEHPAGDSSKRVKEDDSEDVIEVVKVPRSHGMRDIGDAAQQMAMQQPPPHGIKKSKTFRARASQAFRSIKNVGKTTRKTPAQDVFPAKENAVAGALRGESMREARREVWDTEDGQPQPQPPRAPTPKLARRMSRPLSQMFGRGHSSAADESEHASAVPQSQSAYIPSSTSEARRLSSLSAGSLHTLRPGEGDSDRPASPSLSTAPSTSSRRRFSFVNLQSLFTNPASSSSTSPAATNDSLPSTAGPQTPVEDDDAPRYFSRFSTPGTSSSLDIDMEEHYMESRKSSSSNLDSHARQSRDEPPERDISFEMRLDSLHFESLSFDVDRFDIDV
ncbi:hypothetical protein FA95DRAFT_700804 [Auriscalpium vulgare]|uniref:Uncharacterized protein n=1 Tax=Auriscalpium vulgare TaxID=40419 RepID=A0ACB8S2C0_9AGAM|nr:hypothetical protein FA95DRAFT_700804 [Auriscalpium vulgare]